MENKYLAVAGIVLALAVGTFFGSKFSPSSGLNISCTNGGASAGGSNPSLSSATPGSTVLPVQEVRYGASSGTQSSTFPSLSNASTSGSFIANTTFTAAVGAGTVATGTRTSVTSTWDISNGRTCLPLRGQTGNLIFFTVDIKGGFATSTTSCNP